MFTASLLFLLFDSELKVRVKQTQDDSAAILETTSIQK